MEEKHNTFAGVAAEYSDQKITEILNSPNDYSGLIVTACKNEAKKRGLQKTNHSDISEEKYFLHLTEVRNFLKKGKSRDQCEQYLIEKGLNINQVNKIMNTARQRTTQRIKGPYEDKDHYGLKLGTVLFLVALTLKLLRFI